MSLIERIEQAEGPSRELDAEIHASLALEGHRMHPYLVGTFINDGRSGAVYSCPAYTSSIDAALKLVPQGWIAHIVRDFDDDGEFFASVTLIDSFSVRRGCDPEDERSVTVRKGARLSFQDPTALALAAAALKAKEANDGK